MGEPLNGVTRSIHGGALTDEAAQLAVRLEQTRKQGLYAIAALLAVVAFGVGYWLLRDEKPLAPPLADPYQIVQNEQKEIIKLDRRNGEYWILEDGVEVRRQGEFGASRSLLPDKMYNWDKTNDGSKMTVRLKYSGRAAYCAWRIQPSETLKKQLARANEVRSPVKIEFYSQGGVRILSVTGFWSHAHWIQEGTDQLLEIQTEASCSAAMFQDIETCRVWY